MTDISSEAERLACEMDERVKAFDAMIAVQLDSVRETRRTLGAETRQQHVDIAATLRAQAERIKELEDQQDTDMRDLIRAEVIAQVKQQSRKDALREAADVCTAVIRNYDVMKPDGKTYEPFKVQKAAGGMVALARQDILALIEGDTND